MSVRDLISPGPVVLKGLLDSDALLEGELLGYAEDIDDVDFVAVVKVPGYLFLRVVHPSRVTARKDPA